MPMGYHSHQSGTRLLGLLLGGGRFLFDGSQGEEVALVETLLRFPSKQERTVHANNPSSDHIPH